MPSAARLRPPPALHAPRCATLGQILRCAQDDNKSGNKGNSKGNNKSQKQKPVTLSAAKGLASRRVERSAESGIARRRACRRVRGRSRAHERHARDGVAGPRRREACADGLLIRRLSPTRSFGLRPQDDSAFGVTLSIAKGLASRRVWRREGSGVAKGRASRRVGRSAGSGVAKGLCSERSAQRRGDGEDRQANRSRPGNARHRCQSTTMPASFCSASAYLAAVPSMTSRGSDGPGGCLFQPIRSR